MAANFQFGEVMRQKISCAVCAAYMEEQGTCQYCGWQDNSKINVSYSTWLLLNLSMLLLFVVSLSE